MSNIRPSMLPKLAECPRYEPDPNPGPAADRGTALDAAFRSSVDGDFSLVDALPDEQDRSAVSWASLTITTLAGGSLILVTEADCKVKIQGFTEPGTADVIVPAKMLHADLKTGQIRNYREQMAAYALGLMDKHFATEWTAYLLFCDQRQIVRHYFTYVDAVRIVGAVVANAIDPASEPNPCDYCGWCSKEKTCIARLALAEKALVLSVPGFNFAAVLADNEKLGGFLAACQVIDSFREAAEATAKERLQAGGEVPGWKLSTRKAPGFVDAADVARLAESTGIGPVVTAYGPISEKKFRALWDAACPGDPIPEGIIRSGNPIFSLRKVKKETKE